MGVFRRKIKLLLMSAHQTLRQVIIDYWWIRKI